MSAAQVAHLLIPTVLGLGFGTWATQAVDSMIDGRVTKAYLQLAAAIATAVATALWLFAL